MVTVSQISDHKPAKDNTVSIEQMITGKSKETKSLIKLIEMVSKTNSTALILGETGTGKDVIAQAIHKTSHRKGPFVTVNCAAIPAELLESELFGHEKGSFTGADKLRKGRFEQSNGGSMFLDEIGDMPLPLQAKLLRAIENKTIQRVGGSEDIKIDLRLICATHRDLEKKVEASFTEAAILLKTDKATLASELKKIGKDMEGNKVKKLEVLSRLLSFLGYDKPVN